MVAHIKQRIRAVAAERPDWLPHPMLVNLIAALWAAVFALRLLGYH